MRLRQRDEGERKRDEHTSVYVLSWCACPNLSMPARGLGNWSLSDGGVRRPLSAACN